MMTTFLAKRSVDQMRGQREIAKNLLRSQAHVDLQDVRALPPPLTRPARAR